MMPTFTPSGVGREKTGSGVVRRPVRENWMVECRFLPPRWWVHRSDQPFAAADTISLPEPLGAKQSLDQ